MAEEKHRGKGLAVLSIGAILVGALMEWGGLNLQRALMVAGVVGLVAAAAKYSMMKKR